MSGEVILSIVVAAGGLSGVAALAYVVPTFRKIRAEASKTAIEAATLETNADDAHDAAVDARYANLLRIQVEAVVNPLERQVEGLRGEVERQGARIASLEEDLMNSRAKYWKAVRHIRDLYTWIARHMPDAVEGPPPTPEEIAQDV